MLPDLSEGLHLAKFSLELFAKLLPFGSDIIASVWFHREISFSTKWIQKRAGVGAKPRAELYSWKLDTANGMC